MLPNMNWDARCTEIETPEKTEAWVFLLVVVRPENSFPVAIGENMDMQLRPCFAK